MDRAQLTGNYSDYGHAENELNEAFAVGRGVEAFLVRAQLSFALHRYERVSEDLDRAEAATHSNPKRRLGVSASIEALRGSLALEQGDYDEAERRLEVAIARARNFAILTRLAHFRWRIGDFEAAAALYEEAREQFACGSAQGRAWVDLQLGLMDLDRGRLEAALFHYQRADVAFSGWWLFEEHIAEVEALRGNSEDAIRSYRGLVERADKPELMDALAHLLEEAAPAKARILAAGAKARFEDRLERFAEATYGHALGYFLKRAGFEEHALELAKRNVALRPNGAARTQLAQAYLRAGHLEQARREIDMVLASRWTSAETRVTASLIAAQQRDAHRADRLLKSARELNPFVIQQLDWLEPRHLTALPTARFSQRSKEGKQRGSER
jgi:tetratricopeptide (TPR) repeat protein